MDLISKCARKFFVTAQEKSPEKSAEAEELSGAENARWIQDIGENTKTISNITGKVQHVFLKRPIANCNEDNGPLCDNASEVFNVKIKACTRSDILPNKITVFFYDNWAKKCSFIEKEQVISISGASNLIQKSSEKGGEKGDHRFCLCIGGPQFSAKALHEAGAAFELTVKAPPTSTHGGAEVTLNPKNFRKEKIIYPFRTHHEPRKRQKKGQGIKLKVAENVEPKSYDYTLLGNIVYPEGQSQKHKIHVYGVVVNFTMPRPSKGSDWFMTLHIVDHTVPKPRDAIGINVFQHEHSLPMLFQIGDIIRCHRLGITNYDGRIQLVARGGRGISSLVTIPYGYPNQEESDEDAYKCFGTHETVPTLTDSDKEQIDELRRWRDEELLPKQELCNPVNRKNVEYFLSHALKQAHAPADIMNELICMLVNNDAEDILEVWDGTGQSNNQDDSSLSQCLLPLTGNNTVTDGDKVQHKGAILRIYIPPEMKKQPQLQHFKKGIWLRIRKLEVLPTQKAVCRVGEKSSINQIPCGALEVSTIIQKFKNSLAPPQPPPVSSLVRTNSSKRITHASTGELLSNLSEVLAVPAPYSHVSLVEVSHVWDRDFEDLKIMIHLEDDTAEVDAVAFGQQAKTIMGLLRDPEAPELRLKDLYEAEISSHYLKDQTKAFRVDAFRRHLKRT